MSCPRRKLVKAALVAIGATFAGAVTLWACGPFFPDWFVTDEGRMMEAPTTWFRAALAEMAGPLDRFRPVYSEKRGDRPKPLPKAVTAERGPYRQTADVDLEELATLTSNRSLLADYTEVREALARYGETVDAWQQEAAWATQPPPRPEPPQDLRVPLGLPGEIEDYLRGALAYHQGNLVQARAHWERLLDRPAPQRRNRSTWAAFMLGKANLRESPETAIQWFERTRALAGDDLLPDPLGLAAASFGWQARAELDLDRPEKALALYYLQMKAGDPTAIPSMRRVASKALDDPKALKKIAGSDEARPVMTAYVISRWNRPEQDGPLDPAPARKWLAAIQEVNPRNVFDADRLAWVSYRAGDFAAAEEWLKRADGSKPMTHWIQARLFLRAGKLPEAESALRIAGRNAPSAVAAEDEMFQAYENRVQPPVRPHAEGETGATQLAQGKYIDAIYDLLDGGYWSDGAYIVERVLTTEELTAYMEKSWPVKLASHRPEEYGDRWTLLFAGMVSPSQERLAYDLRYLAGRRLVRESRYEEAEKYLPTNLGKPLRTLARSVAEGKDPQRPAEERARSLFRAACITRYQGLELSGTELEPDWFVYEGQYENEPFADARAKGQFTRLGPTPDEVARARKTRVRPFKRFHYRYRGMDLAKQAADLLPDGTEKARILATAGNWIEGRDPKAAQPFLEALLSCCGETEIGERAKRVNAIPNVPDACEAETRVGGTALPGYYPSVLSPLLRFHLSVGARLAMRVLAPTVAAAVGGGMLLGNDFLTTFSHVLFGVKSSGGSGLFVAAIFLGVAWEASPRVCRGMSGWMRHLPVSGVAHRRAAGLAIVAAQTPILLGLMVIAAFASRSAGTLAEDALGLALTAMAMALAATPAQRRWLSLPLALGAGFAAGSGGWPMMILGAALLVAADLAAGPLARTGPPAAHVARRSGGGLFEFRIAWRALGWKLPGAFFLGLLPVGGAFAFVSNNTLAPEHVRLAALLGGGLAFVLLFSQLGESLAVRRPAWPWSRSLPWSASRRVMSDALFLSLHAVPLVALAVAIDPIALVVLGLLPLVAARAAGAMRRAPERKTGAVGEILMEGSFLAALVALVPWTALLTLALTPWAVRAAAERERRQKVSRWLELHHLAAGDPQSWSAS